MGINSVAKEPKTLTNFNEIAVIMNIIIYIRLFKTKSKEKPRRTSSCLRREKVPSCFAKRLAGMMGSCSMRESNVLAPSYDVLIFLHYSKGISFQLLYW